jgi:hypothetical protein
MRNMLLILGCIVLALVVATATSRSEGEPDDPPDPATEPEPTTRTPVDPHPGSETEMKNPFVPYDIGDDAAWPYEILTAAERAQVDRGRNRPEWQGVNDAYAAAARKRSEDAKAAGAAVQLGIDPNLASIGVVP